MSVVFKVSQREKVGQKGFLRQQREDGFIPGVVYGGDDSPVAITVLEKELQKALCLASFQNRVHTLSFSDGRTEKALVREVSVHPVKDNLRHIDFLRVRKGVRVHVTLPIVFKDEEVSPGIKRGGILNIVVQALDVSALIEDIPEMVSFSLADKKVGDSVHLADLNLPSSIKILKLKLDATVATIVAPSGMVDEQEETTAEDLAPDA